MKIYPKILLIIFFTFIFFGCHTVDNDMAKAPPKPDSNTYLLKSYLFDDYNEAKQVQNRDNWTNAAKKIFLWKSLIYQNIKFNYQILAELQHLDFEPEYFANNTWVYEFDYYFDSSDYHIEFYSTYQADSSVFWELRSSKNEQESLKLIEGETNKDNTLGYWVFYKQLFESVTVIKIDWSKQDSVNNLTFHNILPGNYYSGSYLSIDKYTTTENYDLQIISVNSVSSDTAKIRANTVEQYGAIIAPLIYSDSSWHCWDSTRQDVICD